MPSAAARIALTRTDTCTVDRAGKSRYWAPIRLSFHSFVTFSGRLRSSPLANCRVRVAWPAVSRLSRVRAMAKIGAPPPVRSRWKSAGASPRMLAAVPTRQLPLSVHS